MTTSTSATVGLGIDRLLELERRILAGRRIGIVCNPASVDGRFRHTADRLIADPGITVAALFGPQHGFRSDLQDNMIESPHGQDARRRVPVYSLYSETREPTANMLRDIDTLVIDLQDVGTRVYTYVYTMANCMAQMRIAFAAANLSTHHSIGLIGMGGDCAFLYRLEKARPACA